ncbi:MAG: 4Fe-4S binding protein [Chitinophagales bacterium]
MSEFNFNPDFYKTKGDINMAITSDASHQQGLVQKISLTIVGIGLLLLIVAAFGAANTHPTPFLLASMGCLIIGGVAYTLQQYKDRPAGIKNNGVMFGQMTSRGASAWVSGIVITGLYVVLYWYPQYLGLGQDGATNTGLIRMFDPLSMFLKGQAASEWFLYGTLYTVAILVMGFKFIWKYRHNKYQVLRTISVMFFQLGFAFLLPEILQALKYPYYDFKNMWPLNYYFFYDWNINGFLSNGNMGLFMLLFGLAMVFIISPVLTYFYGKRWYCSWVCGCGGLAETAGDPYRHLSDKSLKAWKIERWMIHSVLVFVTVMTISVLYGIFYKNPEGYFVTKDMFVGIVTVILLLVAGFTLLNKEVVREVNSKTRFLIAGVIVAILGFTLFAYAFGSSNVFFVDNYKLQSWYGFFIGAAFSGVVGVGFYPIMGSRVWCRFGCPMAAVLGLQQRFFSRFRITTNSGQCISCGNCSTYCEMGIDVRAYAQKGQNIVRASCVGCGICAAVCPRGVLKLENGPKEERKVIHIRRDDVGFL